jgi:hypothetical protein
MAMFAGYFDESGTHAGVLVVAGYISRVGQWRQFDREWREALLPDFDPAVIPFHMAEFEARRQPWMRDRNAFLRAVQDWTEEKAQTTLNRLTTIINHRAAIGIATAVILNDFEVVANEVGEPENAYTFSVIRCLRLAHRWANAQGSREDIAYVFEDGAEGNDGVNRAASRIQGNDEWRRAYRFHSLTFGTKAQYIQLQAADIASWEARKYALGGPFPGRTSEGMRDSLQILLHDLPHFSEYWNASELRRWAEYGRRERELERAASRQRLVE